MREARTRCERCVCPGSPSPLLVVSSVDLGGTVDGLKQRCIDEFGLDCRRPQLSLRHVHAGTANDVPSLEDEEEAKRTNPLAPHVTLAAAGVRNGAFLLGILSPRSKPRTARRSSPEATPVNNRPSFRELLTRSRPRLKEEILRSLLLRFAPQVLACDTSDGAAELYDFVEALPSTTTQAALVGSWGITLNGPLYQNMGDSQTRLLLGAHVGGRAVVVKLLLGKEAAPLESRLCSLLCLEPWHGEAHPHFLIRTSAIEMAIREEEVASFTRHGRLSALVMPRYALSLAEAPQLSAEALVRGFERMRSSLDYMHSLNLVHCDVTSANVLLTEAGDWLLADFGSCVPLGEPMTSSTTVFHPNIVLRPVVGGFGAASAPPEARFQYDWELLFVMLLVETRKASWKAELIQEGAVSAPRMRAAYSSLLTTAGPSLAALAESINRLAFGF